MRKKVIITDDHPLIIEGIKQFITLQDHYELVGCAFNFEELNELLKQPADILILDLNLNGQNSLDWIAAIKSQSPRIKILIYTSYNMPPIVRKAFEQKVNGYILKDSTEDELLQALKDLAEGKKHIGAKVKIPKYNFTYQKEDNTTFDDAFSKKMNATKRERQIIELIIEGLDNQTIAEKLFISINTVGTHRKNIFKKLDVHSATELAKLFRQ